MILGDYRVEIIPDTEFRLDGGAMFGVVPRVLWERVCPPDELNRVRLNMNCVFIETPAKKILIETGIGEKWSEKETRMYGIFREKPFAQSLFEITDCRPEEITIVVNTHLHFDHAGGNTTLTGTMSPAGGNATVKERVSYTLDEDTLANTRVSAPKPTPQFSNARYLVSKTNSNTPKTLTSDQASYLPDNWRPLRETGQLELMPEDYEVVEGLKMETIRGHSKTMQTWRLDRGGETIYGFADLIPTRHHLSLPWIMGYDLYPAETLAFKKRILPQAVNEKWNCLFYHDSEMPICRINKVDGKLAPKAFVEN